MKALNYKFCNQITIATRITSEQYDYVQNHSHLPLKYHKEARILHTVPDSDSIDLPKVSGSVAVMCAGTSDYGVAEEAAIMLELCRVEKVDRIYDVGLYCQHYYFLLIDVDKVEENIK